MIEPVKKPKTARYNLSAEHMTVEKAQAALKASGLKGVYPKISRDEMFNGWVNVKITGTKVQANRLRKFLWEQSPMAGIEITKAR